MIKNNFNTITNIIATDKYNKDTYLPSSLVLSYDNSYANISVSDNNGNNFDFNIINSYNSEHGLYIVNSGSQKDLHMHKAQINTYGTVRIEDLTDSFDVHYGEDGQITTRIKQVNLKGLINVNKIYKYSTYKGYSIKSISIDDTELYINYPITNSKLSKSIEFKLYLHGYIAYEQIIPSTSALPSTSVNPITTTSSPSTQIPASTIIVNEIFIPLDYDWEKDVILSKYYNIYKSVKSLLDSREQDNEHTYIYYVDVNGEYLYFMQNQNNNTNLLPFNYLNSETINDAFEYNIEHNSSYIYKLRKDTNTNTRDIKTVNKKLILNNLTVISNSTLSFLWNTNACFPEDHFDTDVNIHKITNFSNSFVINNTIINSNTNNNTTTSITTTTLPVHPTITPGDQCVYVTLTTSKNKGNYKTASLSNKYRLKSKTYNLNLFSDLKICEFYIYKPTYSQKYTNTILQFTIKTESKYDLNNLDGVSINELFDINITNNNDEIYYTCAISVNEKYLSYFCVNDKSVTTNATNIKQIDITCPDLLDISVNNIDIKYKGLYLANSNDINKILLSNDEGDPEGYANYAYLLTSEYTYNLNFDGTTTKADYPYLSVNIPDSKHLLYAGYYFIMDGKPSKQEYTYILSVFDVSNLNMNIDDDGSSDFVSSTYMYLNQAHLTSTLSYSSLAANTYITFDRDISNHINYICFANDLTNCNGTSFKPNEITYNVSNTFEYNNSLTYTVTNKSVPVNLDLLNLPINASLNIEYITSDYQYI